MQAATCINLRTARKLCEGGELTKSPQDSSFEIDPLPEVPCSPINAPVLLGT